MADTILKAKVQLRSISVTSNGSNGSASNGGDKTPTTPSKLMINHGKPNFTIQRSLKAQENGENNPLTNELQTNKNNNYYPYKKAESQIYKSNNNNNNNIFISTKFNGAFKPDSLPLTQKQPHQNGGNGDGSDNEAAKVVLRRPKLAEPVIKEGEDDTVPEFIRRQRRIQERLAKENVLDFESRRSGYFTHVVISPTSPNRQSFVETMSSPAVVPALEMPPTTPTTPKSPTPQTSMPTTLEANIKEEEQTQQQQEDAEVNNSKAVNTHHMETVEEEEVAKAIEEVNKAVAGEDDEKPNEQAEQHEHEDEQENEERELKAHVHEEHENAPSEPLVPVITSWHPVEPPAEFQNHATKNNAKEAEVTPVAVVASMEHAKHEEISQASLQNGHIEVVEVHAAPKENGHNEEGYTISHTNGFDGPSIPAPDPSGALGINYEPKTVVSFSKDLGNEINKYPDTVKVTTENDDAKTLVDEDLQEIAKLKFDIKADEQDVQVTPVLRTI